MEEITITSGTPPDHEVTAKSKNQKLYAQSAAINAIHVDPYGQLIFASEAISAAGRMTKTTDAKNPRETRIPTGSYNELPRLGQINGSQSTMYDLEEPESSLENESHRTQVYPVVWEKNLHSHWSV
jgi:hypothetical protein